ncbi:hypothetical protein GCM10020227_22330 [Streptomyces flavovirens]
MAEAAERAMGGTRSGEGASSTTWVACPSVLTTAVGRELHAGPCRPMRNELQVVGVVDEQVAVPVREDRLAAGAD